MTALEKALGKGRSALVGVAGRTVTFLDHGNARVVALVDEAADDNDRRGAPDLNMRRGAVVEVNHAAIGFVPAASEYLLDDRGRRLRVVTVSRRVNLYRIQCEFAE